MVGAKSRSPNEMAHSLKGHVSLLGSSYLITGGPTDIL